MLFAWVLRWDTLEVRFGFSWADLFTGDLLLSGLRWDFQFPSCGFVDLSGLCGFGCLIFTLWVWGCVGILWVLVSFVGLLFGIGVAVYGW